MNEYIKKPLIFTGQLIIVILVSGGAVWGILSLAKSRSYNTEWRASVDMIMDCQDDIRAKARFPAKVDFPTLSYDSKKMDSFKVIFGNVEMMNGLGNMMPYKYACRFSISEELIQSSLK